MAHPASYSTGVNCPSREVNHSSPSSAEVKNEWSLPLLPYMLSRREQGKIPLTLTANRQASQQLGYGLDNREIDSWQGSEFFISSRVLILALGSRAAAIQWTRDHFSKQQSDRRCEASISHLSMNRVKNQQSYTSIPTRAFAGSAGTNSKHKGIL